jgi:hypothetical protein
MPEDVFGEAAVPSGQSGVRFAEADHSQPLKIAAG